MQDVGGEITLEYLNRTLILPGVLLVCMGIFSPAGASLVIDLQANSFCDPQLEYPRNLDDLYSLCTLSSLQEGGDLATVQGVTDQVGSVSPQRPFAQGTVSAWVNQNSMQGNANSVSSMIEYHQKVTASGKIEKFVFSVSCVL